MADRCFTPALGRRLAALFPKATMVEVPGARTFVALDAPAAVADAITHLTEAGRTSS
jgi:pimeloyl-ACP methyl ester carboxylesterase